jgi:hypothetical protein
MKKHSFNLVTSWGFAACALGLVLAYPNPAVADVELPCNISFAEEMTDEEDEFELDLGRIDDFCECKVVTPGFSRYIQARSNFADILSRSTDLCPDVASAISNPAVVTAAAPAAAAAATSGGADSSAPEASPQSQGIFARLASAPVVPSGTSRCTVNKAMSIIQSGDMGGLCDCDVVTLGFVRYLQTRSDLGDILDQTAGQCADLAVVLSETPVAGFFSNRYIASDPRGAARGTCTESECGGEEFTASVSPGPSCTGNDCGGPGPGCTGSDCNPGPTCVGDDCNPDPEPRPLP